MTTPNLRDLEYFLEVVNTGSISRAAERLGLSQPSLSLAIQRLEEGIGAEVLLRSQRGVALTPSGRCVAERAQRLCDDWRRLRDHAVAAHFGVAGRYVIGCHTAVAAYTLPLCLPALQRRYPALELALHHDLSRKVVEATISMRVDLGVVINPVRHPDLVIHRVCHDEVTLWRAAGDAEVNVDVLLCDPHLRQTQALLRRLHVNQQVFARTVESSSLEVIAALTAVGAGVGILPSRVAQQHRVERVAEAPVFNDRLCIIYRVENRHVPAIRAIASHVARALRPPVRADATGEAASPQVS